MAQHGAGMGPPSPGPMTCAGRWAEGLAAAAEIARRQSVVWEFGWMREGDAGGRQTHLASMESKLFGEKSFWDEMACTEM